MKTKDTLLVLLFTVIVQLPISIVLGQNNTPINLTNNWEVWHDNVPVSGEIRVGVMTENIEVSINPTTFYVMIPEHTEKYLSCEISSKDGRYEASVAYDITKLKPGSHEFSLPTKHLNDLKSFSYSDLTILTSITDDLESKAQYYTSASWKPIVNYPEYIYVHLNSERITTIVAEDKSKSERLEFKCNKIETTSSIAYNKMCKIPSNVITSNTELFIKQRVRRMKKISYNSYSISIKLPLHEAW